MEIKIQDRTIVTTKSLQYLGVHFDKDLRMKVHIVETAKKAGLMMRNLSRLMPNKEGPTQSKRRVLNSVLNSIMLYAAPIWSKALKMAKYRDLYIQIQRQMAIRICSAYRTVSTVAIQVLAGTVPIDLLAIERSNTFRKSKEEMGKIKEETKADWQRSWENAEEGSWTRRLIPRLNDWTIRKHGELDFHTTQVLSGHGCFKEYLHRIGRRRTPVCVYCQVEDDTAEHTFFRCQKWNEERINAWTALKTTCTPDNMVATMQKGEEEWNEIKKLANKIMRRKEEDEKKEEDQQSSTQRWWLGMKTASSTEGHAEKTFSVQ